MPELDFPIVGIGASAGGVQALKEFFDVMPPETGMAFVVVLHLPPDGSMLPEILSNQTDMPVRGIEDAMEIEPNHVYTIRPAHYLTLDDGLLRITEPDGKRAHAPVDVFFRTLATEMKNRAVGIVLSGTGANGSLGLREIKARGGLTIAQEPEEAEFQSMPRNAINTGLVDHVLSIADMPAVLGKYAEHPYANGHAEEPAGEDEASATPSDLDQIINIVRRESKYNFANYKAGTLNRRIHRRMGLRHVETLGDYVSLLSKDREEVAALHQDLLIRVTSFFRDPDSFETLKETVLPTIVERANDEIGLRVWVPACSTGEEAFTLAMLLFEELQTSNRALELKVFASDVDREAIGIAREAVYPAAIAEDVPEEYLQRFFVKKEDHYQVAKSIRDCVVFALQNVAEDPPFSRIDLISLRNLLIYLRPEAQEQVLALLHFALREDGHLFLGSAETVGDRSTMFQPVSSKHRIYRRIGPKRAENLKFPGGVWEPRFGTEIDPSEYLITEYEPRHEPLAFGDWARRLIVDRYAPACVVIDREYTVLYFSGDTHDFLVQPIGEPTHDLLKMAREGLTERLGSLLTQALDDDRPLSSKARVKRGPQFFSIRVVVVPLQAPKEAEGLLLVSFEELDLPVSADDDDADDKQQATQIRQLEYKLNLAREDLQSTLERMQSSNEEFRAANEEVRSMNEELQSVNEELETSKEELQSMNEELVSVNQTLESKVDELAKVNNDLGNLLRSTDIAVMFLDRQFQVRLFTPAIKKVFNLISSDIGRPNSDITQKLPDTELLDDAKKVLETLIPIEREILDEDEREPRCFVRTILPYRTEEDRIDGVVVTFTDITQRKRSEDQVRELNRDLERQVEQRTRGIQLLQEVAVIANEADEIRAAFQRAIERVCRQFEWPVGHVFLPDEDDPEQLLDSGVWYLDSEERFANFVEASRDTRFRAGVGLVGRVLETAGTEWVRDPVEQDELPRAEAMRGCGIRAALLVPILIRDEVVGVIEFFACQESELDPHLIDAMGELGTQLGRVIERKRIERRIADATAHEQQSLGRELHDTVAQEVTGVSLMAERLRQDLRDADPEIANTADEIVNHLKGLHQRVRMISHGLMPVEIDPEGLMAALANLAHSGTAHYDIPCKFECPEPVKITGRTAANQLYRIAQEAVHNAARHGKPDAITIRLERNGDEATLSISDTGDGIDGDPADCDGMGLKIMRYRSGVVGGTFNITTNNNDGTTVTCVFPISNS